MSATSSVVVLLVDPDLVVVLEDEAHVLEVEAVHVGVAHVP